MENLDIRISGMSCGHCVASISSALRRIDGVDVTNVAIGSASLSYDPAVTTAEAIRKAVEAAGYPAEVG